MNEISRLGGALGTLAVILALTSACSGEKTSVILISVDSLRYDQIGRVVDGVPVAPFMTRLADESLVYERAISPAPWTTPSMASILTGLPPQAHRVNEHDRALSSEVTTLAELFDDAGYRTAAFVPAITLRESYGMDQGFEIYDFEGFGHNRISSPALIGKVMQRLEEWKDEPYFLWVHLWDPHYNYLPPTGFRYRLSGGTEPESEDVQKLKWEHRPVSEDGAEFLKRRFQEEIIYTDEHVAELFEFLDGAGLSERTVVALVADHGEAFLEHGWLGHTNRLDDELVHVPLMLWGPGRVAPGRVEDTVSTSQLGRTLASLAGLDGNGFGRYSPLPGSAGTTAGDGGVPVLSETVRRGCWHSVASATHRYVLDARTCEEDLFAFDKSDTSSAALEEHRDLMRRALSEIEEWDVPVAETAEREFASARKKLGGLGYVDTFGDREDFENCDESPPMACLDRLER